MNALEKTKESQKIDYKKVVTLLDESVIVMDTNKNRAVWMSERIQSKYPVLNDDCSIENVINSVIDDGQTCESIKKYLYLNGRKKNSKLMIKRGDSETAICCLGNNKYFLKIQRIQTSDEAFIRHMEDRKKLLFASRGFSVSEMASTMAHEINQPVGTINNLLQGIKSRLERREEKDLSIIEAIEKSLAQTEYTSKVIARIRDYAQSKKPRMTAVNIIELIEKCISMMDWEVRHTNLEIEHKNKLSGAIVYGDETMLQQVMVNLIRNGIEAIKAINKRIVIKTEKSDEYLEITISDNGEGLSGEEEENIFMPFTSNKSDGMGIGLNICRSFVELHRGRIWITNNKENGCTSHVLLPLNTQVPP